MSRTLVLEHIQDAEHLDESKTKTQGLFDLTFFIL